MKFYRLELEVGRPEDYYPKGEFRGIEEDFEEKYKNNLYANITDELIEELRIYFSSHKQYIADECNFQTDPEDCRRLKEMDRKGEPDIWFEIPGGTWLEYYDEKLVPVKINGETFYKKEAESDEYVDGQYLRVIPFELTVIQ
jgi:hypothetical protein